MALPWPKRFLVNANGLSYLCLTLRHYMQLASAVARLVFESISGPPHHFIFWVGCFQLEWALWDMLSAAVSVKKLGKFGLASCGRFAWCRRTFPGFFNCGWGGGGLGV